MDSQAAGVTFNSKDFLNSINNSDTSVYVAASTDNEERGQEVLSENVSVFLNGAFIQLDISYDSFNKVEVLNIWNMLNSFISAKNDLNDSNFYISISPNIYDQKYCFIASDPVLWALTGTNPDEVPSVLRIIFPVDFTGIYEFAGIQDTTDTTNPDNFEPLLESEISY